MKAIVFTEYGSPDVLQLKEVTKPAPKANELLVKVYATSVNYGDLLARNFKSVTTRQFNMAAPLLIFAKIYFGLNKPKVTILGSEFSGVVESVGKDVKSFNQGDEVFGYLGQSMGAYAEYLCIPETGAVSLKPANITFEEASVIPYGAIMALSLLRKAKIKAGQKVLINGASGGIGSAAVQIAKNYGAEVTGVCGTPRLEYVKALGADKVIDYNKEDFTQNREKYDVIFDILGKSSFSHCKNLLTDNGIYLLASFKTKQLFQMLYSSLIGDRKVICAMAPGSKEDLNSVKVLIEKGIIKTVIDKYFPAENASEAHRYVESGQKKSNVVITFRNTL